MGLPDPRLLQEVRDLNTTNLSELLGENTRSTQNETDAKQERLSNADIET
ncbi:MAG: hypothetical protein V7L07_31235 [Nostoc sp.]